MAPDVVAEARRREGGLAWETLRSACARAPFFLDAHDGSLSCAFWARHEAAGRALIAQADAVLAGDVSWVAPGAVEDWHAALPDGGRWPLIEAEDVPFGGERPQGDVRLGWELGRCPHLVRLAQAAWLTGEERYADAAVARLRSWIAANPVGIGVGWAHAQEVALRAVAFLWCFRLLERSRAFDDDAFAGWLRTMLAHGSHVEAFLSDDTLTHNHLISELGGLLALGVGIPVFDVAARWRELSLRLLERELAKQVDDEGLQGELSTHYHAFVLDTHVAALLLAERADVAVSWETRWRVERMADATASLLRPDGSLPAIGDTDAGRASRLGLDPLDRRDTVAAAAMLFGRGDWIAACGDAAGAFWLTNGRRLPPRQPPRPELFGRRFRDAGIAVSRSGFEPDAEYVCFRAGATRLRNDVHTSHAHADAGSVSWRIGAQDVLVDPGVHLYSESEGWRVAFRRSCAHSCIVVDGRDQADVSTHRFGVLGLAVARWEEFQSGPGFLIAAATHPAEGAPSVTRRLVWVPGTLVLDDEVAGDGEHEIDSWLQLGESCGTPVGASVELEIAGSLRVRTRVLAAGDPTLEAIRPKEGDGPGPGWRSPRYGVRVPGTALRARFGRRQLPFRVVTIVQAWRGSDEPPAELGVSTEAGGIALSLAGRRLVFPAAGASTQDGA